eukprot:scaffold209647_cov28-Tisochrysis_lutea.AAC.1
MPMNPPPRSLPRLKQNYSTPYTTSPTMLQAPPAAPPPKPKTGSSSFPTPPPLTLGRYYTYWHGDTS